jgi:hypothetical protein
MSRCCVIESRHQQAYVLMHEDDLDPRYDVVAVLERLRKNRGARLKELVNEALRRGLKDMRHRTKRGEHVRTRSWPTANSRSRQHWRSPRHCGGRSLQVIFIDANILIYAHVNSFAQHPTARDWLDQQLNGSGPVGIPGPACLLFCGW